MKLDQATLVLAGEALDVSDIVLNGKRFVPAETPPMFAAPQSDELLSRMAESLRMHVATLRCEGCNKVLADYDAQRGRS